MDNNQTIFLNMINDFKNNGINESDASEFLRERASVLDHQPPSYWIKLFYELHHTRETIVIEIDE